MPIRVLPEVVAAQIAAGEVVERPASVVKELIENALDAGATSMVVEVREGGKRLLRVSDDGIGIPAAEASLAFARHSTSKLQTIDDLDQLQTLGFRGEALASIASVSRTTMVTRHREEQAGVELVLEGGDLRSERPVGAPAGTVISVENLFFNTPARLKFMKAESTERKHINQLVTRYAMAYPDVRFRLVQDDREQFHSTGSGDLADVLVDVLGLDVFREMVEVNPQPPSRPDLPPVEVYGFTSVPNLSRSNRTHIVLFVNGRAIVDQRLTYAVVQAYQTLLPNGRYPLAVLLITLPPEDVDVNVHPTKAEVRFRYQDAVFTAIQRAVRVAISHEDPASDYTGTGYANAWSPPPRPIVPGEEQLQLDMAVPDPGRYPRASEMDSDIPAGPERPARPRTLPILRVIGQIGVTYIVAEGPAGLYLIDQHAAHHRILLEAITEQFETGEKFERETHRAVTVELPPDLARTLENGLEALAVFGFEIEPFGGSTFRVRAVPANVVGQELEHVLYVLARELQGDPNRQAERLIHRLSKLAAIKAGEMLDTDVMQGLIQQLERCASPLVDPDGNPTMVHISGDDLARQFGRE
ncbi:MAG: DNA mismatch repair endonuclease MutL [Chloroflexi bacterium]|nr:DNA mismatch repair endonuclease MutL [Chloroflexota bacterium]